MDAELFSAIEFLDFPKLSQFPAESIKLALPFLHYSLRSVNQQGLKDEILNIISQFEESNTISDLLSANIASCEVSDHITNCLHKFETGDSTSRISLVASVLLEFIKNPDSSCIQELLLQSNNIHQLDVIYSLCVALHQVPHLISVTQVISAFTQLTDSWHLIFPVMLNFPGSFMEVCDDLLKDVQSENSSLETFKKLIQLKPSYLNTLITKACTTTNVPVIIDLVLLKCGLLHDEADMTDFFVQFWLQALFNADLDVRDKLTSSLKMAVRQQRKCASELRAKMQTILQSTSERLLTGDSTPAFCHQLCMLLRLYAGMKALCSARLTDEECDLLLEIITSDRIQQFPAHEMLKKIGFCLLLGLGQLFSLPAKLDTIVSWMKNLSTSLSTCQSGSRGEKFGEFFLLISIHFHSNTLQAISELVASVFNTKGVVRSSVLSKFRNIFTEKVFSESALASFAVQIEVTRNLNDSMTGYLTIHCFQQLLKARIFERYGITVWPWILQQIQQCGTPLHSSILPVLDSFVLSCTHVSSRHTRRNKPINEKALHDILKSPDASFTCRALLAYYLILYHDSCLKYIVELTNKKEAVLFYSKTLYNELPGKFLLARIRSNSTDYPGLLPPLLNLVTAHFPQFCSVDDFFDEFQLPNVSLREIDVASTFRELSSLPVSSPTFLLSLDMLNTTAADQLEPYAADVVTLLNRVLPPETPLRVSELVTSLWQKINISSPYWFHSETLNALRNTATAPIKFIQDSIIMDPLLILRCDTRVFHNPPLLQIILRLLKSYLRQLKVYIDEHVTLTPVTDKGVVVTDTERDELKATLTISQDSAIVQVLLEACHEDNFVGQSKYLIQEVQCIICSFIHQMYTEDKECRLVKLVHFQGYPLNLVPVAVRGIPSMHICLSFIPELLSQPQYEKHIFAIYLLAALCGQYRITQSYAAVRLVFCCLNAMSAVLQRQQRAQYFTIILPQLLKMVKVFPSLANEMIELLLHLQKFCGCGFSLHRLSISPEKQRLVESEKKLRQEITNCVKSLVDHCLVMSPLF